VTVTAHIAHVHLHRQHYQKEGQLQLWLKRTPSIEDSPFFALATAHIKFEMQIGLALLLIVYQTLLPTRTWLIHQKFWSPRTIPLRAAKALSLSADVAICSQNRQL
jgi:hypothetical protein